ncbi:MAG: DUF2793 domain-containing protein [Sphingomonadales bacterium]|nr:DUF2793 domain-containing protein [Sphingomonadales bacterium]MBK9004453.1 DUF2793 domain-containing protein [Sphingomonadales bacterium]MBK9269639.1 DUF2793 domain-containing protein [Sphingomonadales bacterium]
MPNNTPRFALPNIMVSQAHKEITHNEALVCIDALLHMSVAGATATPPNLGESDSGKCLLIEATATGSWAGKEMSIAVWNGFDWRYVEAVAGMTVWHEQDSVEMRYDGSDWRRGASVASPAGGAVVDAEARASLTALLTELRGQGLIGT